MDHSIECIVTILTALSEYFILSNILDILELLMFLKEWIVKTTFKCMCVYWVQ